MGKYNKGRNVFSQGEPADAAFYIRSGKVKISVISEQGKEAVIAVLGANEFFGESCVSGQLMRMSTATALADSVIMRLEKKAIIRVIHEEPDFAEMFISHLLDRTTRIEADLVDQLFNSSENVLPGCCCCWPNLAKTRSLSR